jgi:hypothetical protein
MALISKSHRKSETKNKCISVSKDYHRKYKDLPTNHIELIKYNNNNKFKKV